MVDHELLMRRCLDLARLGKGTVSPNPLVGALLLYEGGILAENYHRQYGKAHAEVLVINEILQKYGDRAPEILSRSTLYVSLEPCSHHGKTPPCADLIVKYKIPRVIVAMTDPSDKVNGRGIARMRDAGIEVMVGVLKEEAEWVNRRFITQVRQNRPYIILKWAQTGDGFMAPADQVKKWITGAEADQLVHRWRSEEDAILVGSGTALADNPKLDVREWKGRNPKRLLIDRSLRIPSSSCILDERAETIIFNEEKTEWRDGLKYIALENFGMYLPQQISYQLYLMDVQSLVVEGGIKVLNTFLEAGLWDEAQIFTSKTTWGSGRKAPIPQGKVWSKTRIGPDTLTQVLNTQTLAHFLRLQ